MPFNGQTWKSVQQHFRSVRCLLGSIQLRESCRPHRKHLKMIGIQIERFARPGQRSVILSEKVMAERVQGGPLKSGVTIAALHGR